MGGIIDSDTALEHGNDFVLFEKSCLYIRISVIKGHIVLFLILEIIPSYL